MATKTKYRLYTTGNYDYEIIKIQKRRWWGWQTIKTYPPFSWVDGEVDLTTRDGNHPIREHAEKLLNLLEDDILVKYPPQRPLLERILF
jgi:hypothetical protein